MPSRKTTPAEKPKPGRPTKFDKRYIDQAYNMALLGLTEEEMCKVFGVVRNTLLTWKREHPDFDRSLQEGKTIADAKVARATFEAACGYSHDEVALHQYQGEVIRTKITRRYPPDMRAAQLWLHNRQSARWRRDPDPANAGDEAPPPVKVIVEVKDARSRPDADA